MKAFHLRHLHFFAAILLAIAPFARAAECSTDTPNPCQRTNVDYTVKEDGSLERYVGGRKSVLNSSPAIGKIRRLLQNGDVDYTDRNVMDLTPTHASTEFKPRNDEFELCCNPP